MRIGLIAPPWIPVPPPAYGGTEVVVDNLARGLQRQGHEVELFTVSESTCPVVRRHLYRRAVTAMGEGASEVAHALAAYEALRDVDVIHDHTLLGGLVARTVAHPPARIVVTNHNPFDLEARMILGRTAAWADVVALSYAHARTAAGVPISAVIHNGVDLDRYRPGPGGGNYLLFVGRMSPEKGVHRAVGIARRAGRPIKIVTKMRTAAEREYYRRFVAPILDPGVEVPAELPTAERIEVMRHADALLDPIRWSEPFGLVMVEALAAGTPVLAFPVGAAPEIVESGRTGFLCASEAEMVAAVARIDEIDRSACRAAAERYFGMDLMVQNYLRLYERVSSGGRTKSIQQHRGDRLIG